MAFNLEKFEYWCYRREHEKACRELLALLADLDANYGLWGANLEVSPSSNMMEHELDAHVLTRITSAISALLSDEKLEFASNWYTNILTTHRWLSTLFAASPYKNADHVIRALNSDPSEDFSRVKVTAKDLIKLCMLYTPESEIPLDLDALWAINKKLAAGLCIALISPRFLGSSSAHLKREQILPWLTQKLYEIDDLEDLPNGVLHDVYMHCSYADRQDKHDVKKPINQLIRKKLTQAGLFNQTKKIPLVNSKPVLLVVLEWFTSGHSIYRTHSLTLAGARENFHVVGMGYGRCVDPITLEIFDEFIEIKSGNIFDEIKQIQDISNDKSAQILYIPSVGMFPLTMYLTNIRVAPIQVMALGHPATTHSDCVDYVAVEEDYVGDPACFTEKLLLLPKDGMPYRPSSLAKDLEPIPPRRVSPDVVEIVLCSTTMKLNPGFLSVCQEIIKRSPVRMHFRFLIGQAQGLIYPQVHRVVKQYLGDYATVYPHQEYKQYMSIIANSDMFINPFPFGNTNGIIDTVSCGLVGVCKTGREVHEHIDEGLFGRLGFPDWMVAHNSEGYIQAVIRLASNHDERYQLSEELSGLNQLHKIFNGRAKILGESFLKIIEEAQLTNK